MTMDASADFEKRLAITQNFEHQVSLQRRKASAHEAAQAKITMSSRKLKVLLKKNHPMQVVTLTKSKDDNSDTHAYMPMNIFQ